MSGQYDDIRSFFTHDNTSDEKKLDSILAKVRALLDKAASTNSPAEADAARAKADQLMTTYALEQWQVDQNRSDADNDVEIRWFDFGWFYSNPWKEQLLQLFSGAARHCRVEAVYRKVGRAATGVQLPAVGLKSDLDWLDLLFTNLMITMISKVDPPADKSKSVEENMAAMREAGLPWADALNRLVRGGVLDSGFGDADSANPQFRYDGRGSKRLYFTKKVYEKTITDYRNWCKRTGHPQSYVSQATFRENFVEGFTEEVELRFMRMRRESQQAYDDSHESGSMALVVRDIKDRVMEVVYQQWPDLRPHPADCDCNNCHWCDDPNCQRPNCRAMRNARLVKSRSAPASRPKKVDWAARDAGRAAGSQVDLANKPSRRVPNNPGRLPR